MLSKQELLKVVDQIDFLAQKDILGIPFLTHNASFNLVTQCPKKVNEVRFCVIFNVTAQDLTSLRGFGEKTAQRLIKNVSTASMNVSFVRFLRAAGMNKLGKTACECIAKNFKNYNDFKKNKALESLQLLVNNGLDQNSLKVITSREFWDDAELLSKFITMA